MAACGAVCVVASGCSSSALLKLRSAAGSVSAGFCLKVVLLCECVAAFLCVCQAHYDSLILFMQLSHKAPCPPHIIHVRVQKAGSRLQSKDFDQTHTRQRKLVTDSLLS